MGDCRLGAISKLLEEKDIFISPAMCFGLGEGYDFNFWVEKNMQLPMIIILGRSINCEERLLENLAIPYKKIGNVNNTIEENEKELEDAFERGSRVFVTVDRYYLGYLHDKYGRSHCGFHSVVLSKSNNKSEYGIFDVLDKKTSVVSKEEIRKARAANVQPFSPNFEGFYIENSLKLGEQADITKDKVLKVIEKNMTRFLEEKDCGIKAFSKFVNQLKILSKMCNDSGYKASFFKVQIKFLCKFIREFEDTHTFYRDVYKKFILEISIKYQINFSNSLKKLSNLSKKWSDLGEQIIKKEEEKMSKQLEFIIIELNELVKYEREIAECILSEIRA